MESSAFCVPKSLSPLGPPSVSLQSRFKWRAFAVAVHVYIGQGFNGHTTRKYFIMYIFLSGIACFFSNSIYASLDSVELSLTLLEAHLKGPQA